MDFLRTFITFLLSLYLGVDAPLYPDKSSSGIVKNNSSTHEESYILKGCNLFDNDKEIETFKGHTCFFSTNGNYLSFYRDKIVYLNKERNVIWKVKESYIHHTRDVDFKNEQLVYVTYAEEDSLYKKKHPVIVRSLKNGEILYSWDAHDFQKELEGIIEYTFLEYYKTKYEKYDEKGDAFIKVNSVAFVPENDLYPKLSYLRPGNLVINLRKFPIVLIVDPNKNKIVWFHRFNVKGAEGGHSPKVLKNGNIVFFENGVLFEESLYRMPFLYKLYFKKRLFKVRNTHKVKDLFIKNLDFRLKSSRIRIFDPLNKKYVFEYSFPYLFYSPILGNIDELDNGNLFVTHISHGGAAFELNRDREIVWEWINPQKDSRGIPSAVLRARKIKKSKLQATLDAQL